MSSSDGIALLAIVVALGTAIVGWTWLSRADKRTETANRIADEALAIARSAEARAHRLEQMSTESRHVEWARVNLDPTVVSYENTGSDTAHDVSLRVTFNRGSFRTRTESFSKIPPSERAGLHVKSQARELAEQVNASGTVVMPVRVLLTWRSALGVPDRWEESILVQAQ